jgi:DNA-binding NtrC family response regulator
MNVLVVEDELEYRDHLVETIREWGHDIRGAENGEEALEILQSFAPHALVTDLMMPKLDGVGLMDRLRTEGRMPPTVVMTAFGTIDKALDVIHRHGAFWFVEKPVDPETLRLLLDRAGAQGRLAAENEELRKQLSFQGVLGDMVGRSRAMLEVFTLIRQVAPTTAPILVTGESGTGKELVARAIHSHSLRRGGPFVALNCAAMPESLIESELFGHEKGAFTGALERRAGAIENAAGGTLFLDELGEMPTPMQAKLLRVLEDYRFRRLGAKQEQQADVRVIAATNRDPAKAIRDGHLREDLYYRLNVFEIALPPLRERKEDIPAIVEAMIHTLNRKHSTRVPGASPAFLESLERHNWDGNVRELRNAVERAVILAGEGPLQPSHLPPALRPAGLPAADFIADAAPPLSTVPAADGPEIRLGVGASIEEAERVLIEATLAHASNNKTRAAAILGISAKTLHAKLKQYRIESEEAEAAVAAS